MLTAGVTPRATLGAQEGGPPLAVEDRPHQPIKSVETR